MSSLSVSLTFGQRIMVQYCHTSIFVLGTIGSLANILLFSRAHLRSNACCIYFLASSLCALMLLPIGIVPQLYALYNSPNPFTSISSFCKARSYLNQTSAMSCRWLLVMACIDRCFSCSTNARIRRFSSFNMARRIIIIILVICLIFPIHVLIFSDIQPPGNIACSVINTDVALYHRFYTIIMGGALPTIISFLCSLFIWQYFQERRKRRLIIISNTLIDRKKKTRDQQILFMLLVQVGIFLISTIPFMSYNTYDVLTRTITNKSIDRKAIESFVKTFTELLVYLISLAFYSNTLVSRTFRKELITLCKQIITCERYQHRQRISPSDTTRSNALQITTTMKIIKTSMPGIAQTT